MSAPGGGFVVFAAGRDRTDWSSREDKSVARGCPCHRPGARCAWRDARRRLGPVGDGEAGRVDGRSGRPSPRPPPTGGGECWRPLSTLGKFNGDVPSPASRWRVRLSSPPEGRGVGRCAFVREGCPSPRPPPTGGGERWRPIGGTRACGLTGGCRVVWCWRCWCLGGMARRGEKGSAVKSRRGRAAVTGADPLPSACHCSE